MYYQKEVIIEGQDQSFAQSARAGWGHALEKAKWRVIGLEDRDALDLDPLDAVPDDMTLESFEIDDDVGILRHARTLLSGPCLRPLSNRCPSSVNGACTWMR